MQPEALHKIKCFYSFKIHKDLMSSFMVISFEICLGLKWQQHWMAWTAYQVRQGKIS